MFFAYIITLLMTSFAPLHAETTFTLNAHDAAEFFDVMTEKDLMQMIYVLYEKVPHAFGSHQCDISFLETEIDPEKIKIIKMLESGTILNRFIVHFIIHHELSSSSSDQQSITIAAKLLLVAKTLKHLNIQRYLSYNQLGEIAKIWLDETAKLGKQKSR